MDPEGAAGPEPVTPIVATPVTGVGPEPLPVPPAWTPDESRVRRRRTALIVVAAIFGVFVLCGISWFLARQAFSAATAGDEISVPSLDETTSEGEDVLPSGVSLAKWADAGRYAVVEYLPSGPDATTTVIAWDSISGAVRNTDGFRIVAVEPASTQVWLTRAVAPSNSPGDLTSAWEASSWDAPESDGPGTVWSWDVATPDAPPVKVARPKWRQWESPTGATAVMSADPKVGLWPNELTFTVDGRTAKASLPVGMTTFLPVGWSPSGRYFAVKNLSRWEGPETRVVIFDSIDGSLKTSYTASGTGEDGPFEQIDGAAWDAQRDELWVTTSMDGDDVEDPQITCTALSVDGSRTPLRNPPEDWKTAFGGAVVLGADAQGVLVSVESDGGQVAWRISGRAATEVGTLDAGDYSATGSGSYSSAGNLVVQINGDPDPKDPSAHYGDVAIVGLDGDNLRYIWPKR